MKRLQVIPFVVMSFITACSSENIIYLDCTVDFDSRLLGKTIEMIYPLTIDLDKGTVSDNDRSYPEVMINDERVYAKSPLEGEPDEYKSYAINRQTLTVSVRYTGTGLGAGSGDGHCVVAEKRQKF